MQKFLESLMVTGTGLVIVFFGLVLLIGLIKLLVTATQNLGRKKKSQPVPSVTLPSVPLPPAAEEPEEVNDAELIAVITAALMGCMDSGSRFTVRRVRRVSNAPAWQKAGREEQIASRF